jgi:hypothetical protein
VAGGGRGGDPWAGSVTAVFGCPPGGGPACTGRLVCAWRDGYVPTGADAALIGMLVDHVVALVHRERTTGPVVDLDAARHVGLALDSNPAGGRRDRDPDDLHHLTLAQARLLLTRASDRTHRSVREVADTVLHTGALPDQRASPCGPPARPATAPARPTPPPATCHRAEPSDTG